MNPEFPHASALDLLGAHILVRCAHAACLRDILDYFAADPAPVWRTPDLIVDCDWTAADRRLFRARYPDEDGPLPGVRVWAPGQPARDWTSLPPPLPPFAIPPLRDRFVGLHGGAVRGADGGCVVVLGARGAGKTTLCLRLVEDRGGALLTDETVVLHRRTQLAEPLFRSVGVWDDGAAGLVKRAAPVRSVCRTLWRGPCPVTRLVVLRRSDTGDHPRVQPLDAGGALKGALAHQVDLGCDPDEAMVTLAELAHRVPAVELVYRTYDQLRSAAALVM